MSHPITRTEWNLKLSQTQTQASLATKAELARNYSEAFELYLRSGQTFLWLLSNHPIHNAPTSDERERLKQMALKVMARAEKIKGTQKGLRPVERDLLSEEEQGSVLVASSLVNGRRFPLWNSGAAGQGGRVEGQPCLSPVQVRKGAEWRRVKADGRGWGRLRGKDIVQDVVTDCSFVAALEVAAEHDYLFGTSLSTSALHPHTSDGQYHVKLFLNGAPRVVTIDDSLPYYPSSERLMCATSRDGTATWPGLLEKAYLTTMGGYDFAGSNGSIDLYALTGWIPEHIFLKHAGFQREKTWNRFRAAWREGRCMATAGTGKAASGGLVSSHNYAILGVEEKGGSGRWVTLMNPWRSALRVRPMIAIERKEEEGTVEESLETLDLDKDDRDGAAFTITWDDLCNHFDSLFLNWDPKLFAHSVSVHSSWRTSSGKQPDPHFRLSITPPASIAVGSEEEVWMLLTRHITSTTSQSLSSGTEYIAIHVFEDDPHSPSMGSQRKAKRMGTYVDGTHCLVRLKPRGGECSYTIVVSRRSEGTPSGDREVNYTLSLHSPFALSLTELRTRLPFSESISGSWTARTAGGNATYGTFMNNPQYSLTVPAGVGEVGVQVVLETSDRKVPVQVLLAYPGGGSGRVTHLTEGDVVLSSGMYHHGLALASSTGLKAGTYTLVVSTFEPNIQTEFALRVESTSPVQVRGIPPEGAGMFFRRLSGVWVKGGSGNPSWCFSVDNGGMGGVVARIRTEATQAGGVRPYINIALFEEKEDGLKEVASSGGYTDLPCGAALSHSNLLPGTYRLLASTHQPNEEAAFTVDFYTSSKVDVTPL